MPDKPRPSRRKLSRRQREAREEAAIMAHFDQLLAGCRAGDVDALAEAWSWIEDTVYGAGTNRKGKPRVPGRRFITSMLLGLRKFVQTQIDAGKVKEDRR